MTRGKKKCEILKTIRCQVAKKNGIPKAKIDEIVADEDLETVVGDNTEVSGARKCSCLLYLYRADDGDIHVIRSTKSVIYQPDTPIRGLKKYPIASFVWTHRKNSARGIGEVLPLAGAVCVCPMTK